MSYANITPGWAVAHQTQRTSKRRSTAHAHSLVRVGKLTCLLAALISIYSCDNQQSENDIDFHKADTIDDGEKSSGESEYYNSGYIKFVNNDFQGAIADFTKAIEQNPSKAEIYFYRGMSKNQLEDYRGAIVDFTRAIELESNYKLPSYTNAFFYRGNAKFLVKDLRGAVTDFTKAIELTPQLADQAYMNRGVANYELGLKDNGCLDFSKAGELGHPKAYAAIKDLCNN